MRTLYTAACLALCSTSVLAADFGIGVSARSDDAWIYAPINISQNFRIEPSIRYVSNEYSTTQQSGVSVADTYSQETESLEFGVGVFRLVKIAESAQLYFGARVAYVDFESTVDDTVTYFPGYSVAAHSESSQDGYRIGPTIGFEYLFGEHFSIGGEASYTFLDIEGESKLTVEDSLSSTRVETEQKTNGTTTQLIFRYRF